MLILIPNFFIRKLNKTFEYGLWLTGYLSGWGTMNSATRAKLSIGRILQNRPSRQAILQYFKNSATKLQNV